MQLRARETVVFAEDFGVMVDWYVDTLGFKIQRRFDGEYNYANLVNESGIRLGIADAKQMGVVPEDRTTNTVVLQFEVPDVPELLDYLGNKGGVVTFGPSFDKRDGFWYGGFTDIEGNPIWVVDEKCP